jgi:hypothetical protein
MLQTYDWFDVIVDFFVGIDSVFVANEKASNKIVATNTSFFL